MATKKIIAICVTVSIVIGLGYIFRSSKLYENTPYSQAQRDSSPIFYVDVVSYPDNLKEDYVSKVLQDDWIKYNPKHNVYKSSLSTSNITDKDLQYWFKNTKTDQTVEVGKHLSISDESFLEALVASLNSLPDNLYINASNVTISPKGAKVYRLISDPYIEEGWAFGTALRLYRENEDFDVDQTLVAAGKKSENGDWEIVYEGMPEFYQLYLEAPDQVVSSNTKDYIKKYLLN